jgi:hypothetical protein
MLPTLSWCHEGCYSSAQSYGVPPSGTIRKSRLASLTAVFLSIYPSCSTGREALTLVCG